MYTILVEPYVSDLARSLIFPKSHPIKFLNLFFALHSRILIDDDDAKYMFLRELTTASSLARKIKIAKLKLN